MAKVLIRAVAAAGFWRCGEFWPHAGRVVDTLDFSEDELAVLGAETMLRIGPAPDEADVEAAASATEAEALAERLRSAFATLEPADFAPDGRPKVGPLRALLPQEAKRITVQLVGEVWDALKAPGAPGI